MSVKTPGAAHLCDVGQGLGSDAPTPYRLTVHPTASDIALRAAGITQFIAVPAATPEHADTHLQEAS